MTEKTADNLAIQMLYGFLVDNNRNNNLSQKLFAWFETHYMIQSSRSPT